MPTAQTRRRSSPEISGYRVVIAHDYLTQRGGAERVVLTLAQMFPDAPIVTSVYEAQSTFPEFANHTIRTSKLQSLPRFRRDPRLALPLLPAIWSRFHVRANDIVIASSTGFAHAVKTDGRKIVYCHNPPRWLYQPHHYLIGAHGLMAAGLRATAPALRAWDQKAAASADAYLANSHGTATRIRNTYGIEARVVHPPSVFNGGPGEPLADIEPGFLMCIARNRGYKQVTVACEAVESLDNERLVVVGELPERTDGRPWSTRITSRPNLSDAQLAWLYANCDALIAPAYEDFGLTPVEAAGFGKPTVALKAGGYLETVVDGVTGVFAAEATAEAFADAIRQLRLMELSSEQVLAQAEKFTVDYFAEQIHEVVDQLLGARA